MSFQRFQCEVESEQPDTRLAQYLRHKSTVSLPPNLTERSLVHFIPALRLLKPHVKKALEDRITPDVKPLCSKPQCELRGASESSSREQWNCDPSGVRSGAVMSSDVISEV